MQLSWQQGEAGESLGASAWWDKYREETQQLPTIAIAKKKPNLKKLKKNSPYLHYKFHAVIQSSSTYSPPPSLLLVQQIRPQIPTTIPTSVSKQEDAHKKMTPLSNVTRRRRLKKISIRVSSNSSSLRG